MYELPQPHHGTAVSVAGTSRETTVCNRITVAAAITTGSMETSGREPCAPRPYMMILHNRDIVAVAIGSTRCAGIRQSGLFFHRQSVHIGRSNAVAPPPLCNTPTTPVPPTPFSTW